MEDSWKNLTFDIENNSILDIENMEIVGNYGINEENDIQIKIQSKYLPVNQNIVEEKLIDADLKYKKIKIVADISTDDNIDSKEVKLLKTQTGIAGEYYVAGELSRLGYNVALTFGNTKSIDLLIEKDDKVIAIQVKGIQKIQSICWNLDKRKITEKVFYVLVNLHVDKPKEKPEFFILTSSEARELFKNTTKQGENRTYLDYKSLKKLDGYQDCWEKLSWYPR